MKKHFILAAMAMTALFSACSNEDDNLKNENEGKKVTFVIGGVDSRTATTGSLGSYTTEFGANDEVGMYATDVQSTVANSKYTVTETNSIQTLTGADITYTEEQTPTFIAYYPYACEESTTTEASGVVTMTVGDQSTGIDAYDLMTAEGELDEEGATVSFDFAHQLAMIEVEIVGSKSSSVTSMTLNNIMPTVTWTAASNTIGVASGTATDINMYKLPDITENVYVALVPAQPIESGKTIFTTLIGYTNYTFTTNSDITLKSGDIKRYKITINEEGEEPSVTEVTKLGLNIVQWNWDAQNTVVDETLSKTETEIPATVLISAETFNAATLSETTYTGYTSVPVGEWAEIVTETDFCEVSLNNGTLTMANTNTASAWYRTGLAYHTEGVTNPTTYNLSFNLASENTEGKIYVRVYINGTEIKTYTPQPREAAYSLSFDLSTAGKEGIVIAFAPYTVSDTSTYTITNLTMTESRN